MLHVSTRTGCAGAGFESSSVGDGTNRRPPVRSRMNGKPPSCRRPGVGSINQRSAQAASLSARHGRTREGAARESRSPFSRIEIPSSANLRSPPPELAQNRWRCRSRTTAQLPRRVSPPPLSPRPIRARARTCAFGFAKATRTAACARSPRVRASHACPGHSGRGSARAPLSCSFAARPIPSP